MANSKSTTSSNARRRRPKRRLSRKMLDHAMRDLLRRLNSQCRLADALESTVEGSLHIAPQPVNAPLLLCGAQTLASELRSIRSFVGMINEAAGRGACNG